MKKHKIILLCFISLCCAAGCKQKPVPAYNDTFSSGTINIAADESFAPIIDDENYIFKALDKKADPRIIYKSENQAVNLLLQDSVREVILSRELDSNETRVLKTKKLIIESNKFAIDAVAIIVNKTSNDTTITVDEIKKMLNGETKSAMNIVFDNPGSSLVRYLKDFSGGAGFKPKNVFALKSNKEVIKYISTHPDAIGFTGFNWLNDPSADYAEAVKNVNVVAVKDEGNKKYGDKYFKPSQTTLSQGQYALSRSLYIINCTSRQGLATGFASFLTSERGQNIILSSGILPADMPGREVEIEHKLK